MKSLLSLFFAATLLGCAPDATSQSVADRPSSPTPQAAAASNVTPSAIPSKQDSPKQDPSGLQTGDNPNRVNQLRQLKVVDLKAAGETIHAWIMDNESKREEGMMFLVPKDVKEDQGMIFLFPDLQRLSAGYGFWMHNCPMGLDIIYISPSHRVINIGDGKPESDAIVPAKGDYQYVLEMKRGWSERHNLHPGDLITIPDDLKTTE